jgi:hypothetical protein
MARKVRHSSKRTDDVLVSTRKQLLLLTGTRFVDLAGVDYPMHSVVTSNGLFL